MHSLTLRRILYFLKENFTKSEWSYIRGRNKKICKLSSETLLLLQSRGTLQVNSVSEKTKAVKHTQTEKKKADRLEKVQHQQH